MHIYRFLVLVAGMVATFCSVARANELYVDAAWYGKGGDGSEAAPFGTIQDAVDSADAGSTILVRPGTYDKGGKPDGGAVNIVTNRVYINKTLTLKSLGSAADTFIVGAFDKATGKYGPSAVRAVCVNGAAGTRIEGFTLCNSAGGDGLHYGSPNATQDRFGGGFSATRLDVYLIDSVVSNCWGYYGGGTYKGTLVRCLVSDNRSHTTPSGCRGSSLWNCVITRNHSPDGGNTIPALGENALVAVNCTIAGNGGRGASNGGNNGGKLYNCLFSANDREDIITGSNHFTAYNSFTSADGTFPLMGPAVNDWRLRNGTGAVNGGLTSYLTDIIALPEDIEMTDFYGNEINTNIETCAIGAVQEAITPAAGGIYFLHNSQYVSHHVEGNANFHYTYYFPDRWPVQIRVRPVVDSNQSGREFYCYLADTNGINNLAGSFARYAQLDGDMYFVPPPGKDTVMTNSAVSTANILWCKPDADASVADGSYGRPYRTIQAAVDTRDNGTRCIIKCMPGTYAEGGAWKFGASNRVAFAVTRSYLLKGVNGAAETFIEGVADDAGAYPSQYPGCGPKAMRCICFHNYVHNWASAVQGFTLRNGHSNALEGNAVTSVGGDGQGNRGGAVYGGGDSAALYAAVQVLDCVITNCTAVRGAASDLAWLNRCKIYDCMSYSGIAVRGYATSCYFDKSNRRGTGVDGIGTAGLFADSFTTIHCTAPYPSATAYTRHLSDAYIAHTATGADYWGSVAMRGYAASSLVLLSPLFANHYAGDWSIVENPALTAQLSLPAESDDDYATWASLYATFAGGDIDGERVIYENGVPLPGAKQSRGQFVARTWYVDADEEKGSDTNDGLSADTPFLTLKKALSTAEPGDIVYAAAGTYDSEVMMPEDWQEKGYTVGCRALVPRGVALIGAGAESTFIVGASSTFADADVSQYGAGRGAGAVRCVMMDDDTRLKGFTLTGGRTDYKEREGKTDADCAYHPDFHSAGVYSLNRNKARVVVEDCIFEGNRAYRGGAGRYATFKRCTFTGNSANFGAVGGEADFKECLIYDNYGWAALYYYHAIEGCTFGFHYKADGVTQETCLSTPMAGDCRILNTIFKAYVVGSQEVTAKSCLFDPRLCVSSYFTYDNCINANYDKFGLDQNYRPIPGNSLAIDAGDITLYDGSGIAEFDRDGKPRVSNGQVDIGCFEADWRGNYSEAIAPRRFSVTSASSTVKLDESGNVILAGEASLVAEWKRSKAEESTRSIDFEVFEGGALAVTVNGEKTVFAAGRHTLTYSGASERDTVVFESSGAGAAILSAREYKGAAIIVR